MWPITRDNDRNVVVTCTLMPNEKEREAVVFRLCSTRDFNGLKHNISFLTGLVNTISIF
jgi:hypothetical protein